MKSIKSSGIFLVRCFLFWLLSFQFFRIVFLAFFLPKAKSDSLGGVLAALWHALPLDVSATCYIIVPVLLIIILQSILPFKFARPAILIYTGIVVFVAALIYGIELGIYDAWDTKVNYRTLTFFQYAQGTLDFVNYSLIIFLCIIFLIEIVGLHWLFRKFILSKNSLHLKWPAAVMCLFITPLLFIGIRGGLQLIPINESRCYYSDNQFLNDAATNSLWYALNNVYQNWNNSNVNPYHFADAAEANDLVATIYTPEKDSVTRVLTIPRPNVVIIIIESFTADVIEKLGGVKGVTPGFDSLIQQGLLFTNIYSQGFRTDQGLADVLSAFPAQPNYSIITQTEKLQHLSFLPKKFLNEGYHTAFYYGGELGFTNMKSYLLNAGMQSVTGKESFPPDEMGEKWGAHDQYVLMKQAHEPKQQPFFNVILTLSSHEPFNVPMKHRFPGDDNTSKFLSACAYTDSCLENYFREAKKTDWYANTLFILVADHGHHLAMHRDMTEPARFHIPLLFYGDVLKPEFRGNTNSMLGMQVNIAATLLAQLQWPDTTFEWSNNLLNPFAKQFAYYTYDSGFGWVTPNGSMHMNFNEHNPQVTGLSNTEVKTGEAFLQQLFGEYMSY